MRSMVKWLVVAVCLASFAARAEVVLFTGTEKEVMWWYNADGTNFQSGPTLEQLYVVMNFTEPTKTTIADLVWVRCYTCPVSKQKFANFLRTFVVRAVLPTLPAGKLVLDLYEPNMDTESMLVGTKKALSGYAMTKQSGSTYGTEQVSLKANTAIAKGCTTVDAAVTAVKTYLTKKGYQINDYSE